MNCLKILNELVVNGSLRPNVTRKGNIERYKARLITKGFIQKDGIDYKETFSPISKKDSLRIVLTLMAHYDSELHQIDVRTAFLSRDLYEEVYMNQPKGFFLLERKIWCVN